MWVGGSMLYTPVHIGPSGDHICEIYLLHCMVNCLQSLLTLLSAREDLNSRTLFWTGVTTTCLFETYTAWQYDFSLWQQHSGPQSSYVTIVGDVLCGGPHSFPWFVCIYIGAKKSLQIPKGGSSSLLAPTRGWWINCIAWVFHPHWWLYVIGNSQQLKLACKYIYLYFVRSVLPGMVVICSFALKCMTFDLQCTMVVETTPSKEVTHTLLYNPMK